MIIGIGLDLIEVARVRKALENRRFLARVYSPEEQQYLVKHNLNAMSAAGMFAAKEAVAKALGSGLGRISWTEIEVLREETGRPYVRLTGDARQRLMDIGGISVHISITHIKEYAAAQAVIEG